MYAVVAWGGFAILLHDPAAAIARPLHVRVSTPAAETIIHGDNTQYVIRFDGPVNHDASRMDIKQGDRVVAVLTPRADSAVDVLYATARTPPPGRYALHWEAVSADGDVSRGDIPFTVQP